MKYYSFGKYLKDKYGVKICKLSLNAGFTCPNKSEKDDGCIFCNEFGFAHFPEDNLSLKKQLESSLKSGRDKRGAEKFLAYFQNATGTNASVEKLKETYDVIKAHPEIVGLFISTRPDCISEEKLDLIASYKDKYEVWIEYGVQSAKNKTLRFINRGHSFKESAKAIEETAKRGIKVGAHVILGLPGENNRDLVKTARSLSKLPTSGIKIHALHVLKDTPLEKLYNEKKITLLTQDEYIEKVCLFLENTRPDMVVLRLLSDAKDEYLVGPRWINDKLRILSKIEKMLDRKGTHQGSAW